MATQMGVMLDGLSDLMVMQGGTLLAEEAKAITFTVELATRGLATEAETRGLAAALATRGLAVTLREDRL